MVNFQLLFLYNITLMTEVAWNVTPCRLPTTYQHLEECTATIFELNIKVQKITV